MSNSKGKSQNKTYRCWISNDDRIISFSNIDGYELKEFDYFLEFQEYYYRKTCWGYRVK